LIPAAIGEKNGVVNFWLSSGGKGRELTDFNSLKKPLKVKTRPADVEFRQFKVVCFTLDYLARLYSIKGVDLIWMDVQGAELEVFSGAVETLKRTRYIYTECQEGRYEGQPGLKRILEVLPEWKMILTNGDNVLLEKKGS
jgi:FkbM family methyltransferase